ncbi:hypothetical protein SDC9_198471 [bioreactor metagenome]|uniref:Uncharacterized protein n=1 Tax=bioreactor metagenome TaxID=1076179 RepID=A0A645IJ14_9ZZZZ
MSYRDIITNDSRIIIHNMYSRVILDVGVFANFYRLNIASYHRIIPDIRAFADRYVTNYKNARCYINIFTNCRLNTTIRKNILVHLLQQLLIDLEIQFF